jgi:hypothetical protein
MTFDFSQLHELTDDEIVGGYKLLCAGDTADNGLDQLVIELLDQMQKPAFRPVYVEWPNGIRVFIQLERGYRTPNPTQLYSAFQMALASLVISENISGECSQ